MLVMRVIIRSLASIVNISNGHLMSSLALICLAFSQMSTFNRGQQMALNIQICPIRNASVFTIAANCIGKAYTFQMFISTWCNYDFLSATLPINLLFRATKRIFWKWWKTSKVSFSVPCIRDDLSIWQYVWYYHIWMGSVTFYDRFVAKVCFTFPIT